MKSASVKLLTLLLLASLCAFASGARQWSVLGPDGGDVRSLAYDPHNPDRILLGTSTGGIFVSDDNGHSWSRFAKLGAMATITFSTTSLLILKIRSTFLSPPGACRTRVRATFSALTTAARIGKLCRACTANRCALMAVSASDENVRSGRRFGWRIPQQRRRQQLAEDFSQRRHR